MEPDTLTSEQAEAMLKQLSRHYHEPVMPISKYCAGLRTWATAISNRAQKLEKKLLPNLHDWDKTDSGGSQRTPKATAQMAE